MATREKEAELVFRGNQYVRAIALFQRKFANTNPPTIDLLVEQRFLRKKFKDPITNDDFQPIYANQAMQGVQRARRRSTTRTTSHRVTRHAGPADDPGRFRQHRRHRCRRHYRRHLEEQRDLDQDLQRPRQIQRVGVRLHSDGAAPRRAGQAGAGAGTGHVLGKAARAESGRRAAAGAVRDAAGRVWKSWRNGPGGPGGPQPSRPPVGFPSQARSDPGNASARRPPAGLSQGARPPGPNLDQIASRPRRAVRGALPEFPPRSRVGWTRFERNAT